MSADLRLGRETIDAMARLLDGAFADGRAALASAIAEVEALRADAAAYREAIKALLPYAPASSRAAEVARAALERPL